MLTYHIAETSREKTFTNFVVLWLYAMVFSAKFGAWCLWRSKSEQSVKVFSAKIVFFTNSRKFSPSKVSCYTVHVSHLVSYIRTFLIKNLIMHIRLFPSSKRRRRKGLVSAIWTCTYLSPNFKLTNPLYKMYDLICFRVASFRHYFTGEEANDAFTVT